MEQVKTSVVVVSRGRPDSLRLCLIGLSRLLHRNYEVIVVADPDGVAAARSLLFSGQLKIVPFSTPNISAGRNLGVSAAAGQVIAFIDDDAVPEPGWLAHLTDVFRDPLVAAAGGFVIGRNGISYQWKARSVGPDGESAPLDVDGENPSVPSTASGRAVKTEGTNMAVRRDVLEKLGGFDESFRFFMDETDLNMRLAAAGFRTALVPLAVVHHAYAPSPRRRQDRAVLDLTDVGRSSMLFWRKHAAGRDLDELQKRLKDQQRQRVMSQMVRGLLTPGEARRTLRSLRSGLAEGGTASIRHQGFVTPVTTDFRSFPTRANGRAVSLSGGPLTRKALRRRASALAAEGCTVSLYLLSYTALFHTVEFCADGYWLQQGGVFGKSDRSAPLFVPYSKRARVRQEQVRIGQARHHPLFVCQLEGNN